MKALKISGFIVLYILSTTWAYPKFNEVNGNDLQGNKCPLPTYYSYPCPSLCVRDINSCPEEARPSCPSGQTYCVDGSCRESCPSSLTSTCACPGAPALTVPVYSCSESFSLSVNIHNFNADNKTEQSAEACTHAANLTNIPTWSSSPEVAMWLECPTPDYGQLTFGEDVFIALFTYYGSCLVLLVGWSLLKYIREKSVKDNFNKIKELRTEDYEKNSKEKGLSVSDNDDDDDLSTIEEEDAMTVYGYKRTLVGTIAAIIFFIQTIGQIAYMVMITYDYYNGNLMFRGFTVVNTGTFMGMWYIYFIWFACLTIFKSRLSNFFRIRCAYDQGQYVQVERKEPNQIFLDDGSDIVMDFVRYLERLSKKVAGLDVVVTSAPIHMTSKGKKYFVYQCTRYVYDPSSQLFRPHQIELGSTHGELASLTNGLTMEEAEERQELIGSNFISVYVPNFFSAMFREFASFFYIYQFSVLWLFYYYNYWQVGVADTGVILISATVKVVVRLTSEKRIKKMAEFTDKISILRDGCWSEKSTAELLPGDVFEVIEGKTTPCDAAVLTGNVVADESSLTGEPLPIRKFPLRRDDNTIYEPMTTSKISTLFAGTILSQAQSTTPGEKVTALVTKTGTATDKGELVKKILFPTRVSFIFNEQIKIVILILLCCSMVCLAAGVWLVGGGTSAWFYSMYAISQLVSPLLPAALVIGQSVTAGRLRQKNIFCVDLPRILMAGKVQLFCFDKTGTLTKEGLEFYGTQSVKNTDKPTFESHVLENESTPRLMQIGLATCHAVTVLNDQFIGNPVDIEMFRSSKWKLAEKSDYVDTVTPPMTQPGVSTAPVHIIKRFEFVHARMSMSVAVLDTLENKVHVFVKGAYEKIKDISNPESIPHDYDVTAANLAKQGCYVLAFAHREIDLDAIGGLDGFKDWTREQMEENVDCLGLILFKNQLKEDTAENIAELKQGDTRTIMITGDTALTGVYIARQCGMCLSNSKVLLGDYHSETGRVIWSDVDEPEIFSDVNVDDYLLNKDHTPVELAVTGKAFHWLVDQNLIRKYLLDIRVFARMTPNGKVQCVQLHMERGITAMTGDGGNDCGALRAAHVGIAMSDAEASIVSPFSTSVRSVQSCVELIRQGRAALATSINGYKYLILYGQIMFMLKFFTFYFSVTMSQELWILVDVLITVLLTWAVSQSKAATHLADQRPTARLLGPQTLASGFGLAALNWLTISMAYKLLFAQDFYACSMFDSKAVDMSKWWLLSDNYEGEVLAMVCLFLFINNAAVFNFGYKFRQSFWRNYSLVFLWVLYLIFASYWLLADPNLFGCAFRFNCGTKEVLEQFGYAAPSVSITPYNIPLGHNVLPWEFRWKLWGLIIGMLSVELMYERLIVLGPIRAYLARKFPVKRLKIEN